jgi:hypothetical protein
MARKAPRCASEVAVAAEPDCDNAFARSAEAAPVVCGDASILAAPVAAEPTPPSGMSTGADEPTPADVGEAAEARELETAPSTAMQPAGDDMELERAIEQAFLAGAGIARSEKQPAAARVGAQFVSPTEPPRRRHILRRARAWRSAAATLPQF